MRFLNSSSNCDHCDMKEWGNSLYKVCCLMEVYRFKHIDSVESFDEVGSCYYYGCGTGRSFLSKKYAAVISPGLSYQSYDCKYICSNKSDSRLWLLKFFLEKKNIYIRQWIIQSWIIKKSDWVISYMTWKEIPSNTKSDRFKIINHSLFEIFFGKYIWMIMIQSK